MARFEKRQQRREKRARERRASDPDRDDDSTPTRFLATNLSEASQLVTQCGCSLCKIYEKTTPLNPSRFCEALRPVLPVSRELIEHKEEATVRVRVPLDTKDVEHRTASHVCIDDCAAVAQVLAL